MAAIDRNRFRKIYRYIRRKPEFKEDLNVIIEAGEISFDNSNSGSYSFTKIFTSAPFVTATAYDSSSNEQANVTVFITSVSRTSFTIETSAAFTGKVQFQAVLSVA